MFPILLDLKNKPVLIIGAGNVGERKINSVLESGADVTVISATSTDHVTKLSDEGRIRLINKQYEDGDCEGFFVVIASTDDNEINEAISKECLNKGILVNIVDRPEFCSFYVPAVVRHGDFTLAVSTGGKSPALAREVRKELQETYTNKYGELTDELGRVREDLKKKFINNRNELASKLQDTFNRKFEEFKKHF